MRNMKKQSSTKKSESLLSKLEKVIAADKEAPLDAINALSIIAENMKEYDTMICLDNEAMSGDVAEVNEAFRYIAEKYNLSDFQIMVLAAIIDKGDKITINGIGESIHVGPIKMMKYEPELKQLLNNKMIMAKRVERDYEGYLCYCLTKEMRDAISNDAKFVPQNISGITLQELLSIVNDLMNAHFNGEIKYSDMENELLNLMQSNPNLPFVHKVKSYDLADDDFVLLMYFVNQFINQGDDTVYFRGLCSFYGSSLKDRLCYQLLISGHHTLLTKKIIESADNDGFANTHGFTLSKKTKKELFSELGLTFYTRSHDNFGLTRAKSITPKQLMYNPIEGEQIGVLTNLLGKNNFKNIQRRMEQEGMRTGFACLFYGAPGTGKTESVKQLARLTGRDIMQVDLSTIRNKYVGESEKNAKAIFDDYREAVSKSKVCPILLLNEADGLISSRSTSIGHHVDKMENTMQNIFLQELEDLNGILIATTNLCANLDSAFERRFIYKIEFKKPESDVRKKIWKSIMPKLADEDASKLASKYEFSGGQIENIARKQMIEHVLYGEECSFDKLCKFCDSENNTSFKETHRKVGF